MIDNTESTPRDLRNSERIARFAVVLLIQLLGVGIILVLLRTSGAGWQTDCIRIAYWAAGVSVGVLVLALLLIILIPSWVKATESLIFFAFLVNTLACFMALTRTGGPVNSLFGPLIPIQLSGILVLEQQKEALTKRPSRLPWAYAGVSIALWLAAHFFGRQINEVLHWAPAGQSQLTGIYATEAALLTAVGMLFTAITYFLPRNQKFLRLASGIIKD